MFPSMLTFFLSVLCTVQLELIQDKEHGGMDNSANGNATLLNGSIISKANTTIIVNDTSGLVTINYRNTSEGNQETRTMVPENLSEGTVGITLLSSTPTYGVPVSSTIPLGTLTFKTLISTTPVYSVPVSGTIPSVKSTFKTPMSSTQVASVPVSSTISSGTSTLKTPISSTPATELPSVPVSSTISLGTSTLKTPISSTPYDGSIYKVNESKTEVEILTEANILTCGKFAVCYARTTSIDYFESRPCFACSECYCDEQCSHFGDCCVDIAKPSSKIQTTLNCVKRVTMDFAPRKYKTAQMIQTCAEGSGSDDPGDIRRCLETSKKSREDIIPVTDMSTNITYRNQFCARCNGIKDVVAWELYVDCDPTVIDITKPKDQIWLDVFESDSCIIYDEPPNGIEPRSCLVVDVSSCNTSLSNNSVTQRLCQPGNGPQIEVDDTVYLNVFCALCNGIEIDKNCRNTFLYDPVHTPISSLKVLLDFNVRVDGLLDDDALTRESNCSKDKEAYDPIMRNCSAVWCAPRWDYSVQTCKPIFLSASGLGFQLDLSVLTSRGMNNTDIILTESEFENVLKKSLEETFDVNFFGGYFRKLRSGITIAQPARATSNLFFGFFTSLQLATLSPISQAIMEQSLKAVGNRSYAVSVANETIHLDVSPVIYCDENFKYHLQTGHWDNEINHVQNPVYNCPFDDCRVDYIPVFEFVDCPFIKVNLSSTSHKYYAINSSIVINNNIVELRPNVHIYCNQLMQVCLDYLPKIKEQLSSLGNRGGNSAMGIVSVACISLSLFCLLITFVIFCQIPQLRTLPGKNTMALVFHLFCAQLLFQTGINATENVKICWAMALLIHYFWLTAFGWMAVCAYHMWSTFSNIAVLGPRGNHLKILTRFVIVCHAMALICVLTCVSYHLAISDGKHIGYGGSICFLVDPIDIGIFFGAPLGMILLFNVVCFLMTIRAIRAVPDMKSTRNQSNKNHTDVYFRLSILLGFTWIFGFIAAGLRSDIFWYIFVVLNGLQGVFISLAYCGTRRTTTLIRESLSQSQMFSLISMTHSSSLHTDSEHRHQKKCKTVDVELLKKSRLEDRSLETNWKDKIESPSSTLTSKGDTTPEGSDSRPEHKDHRLVSSASRNTYEIPTDTLTSCTNLGNSMTETTHF